MIDKKLQDQNLQKAINNIKNIRQLDMENGEPVIKEKTFSCLKKILTIQVCFRKNDILTDMVCIQFNK